MKTPPSLDCPQLGCPVRVYAHTAMRRFHLVARHLERRHGVTGKEPEEVRPRPIAPELPEDEFADVIPLFGTTHDPQTGETKIRMPQ